MGRGVGLLLLGSVAGSLALAEALVRAVDPAGISYYAEAHRANLDRDADPELVFRNRPGLRARYQGVEVAINALGLRDDPVATRSSGGIRILALGDSVTYGWGVAAEDRYTERLEARLAGPGGGPVDVVNTGVGGYNTEQEAAFLARHVDALEPDLVTLLYVDNDVEINEGRYDPRAAASPWGKDPVYAIRLVLSRSWVFRLAEHAARYRRAAPAAPDRAAPGWQRSMTALSDIATRLRKRDVPFIVFLYGMGRDARTDALHEDLEARSRSEAFAYTDLRGAFAGRERRRLMNSVVDAHPNAAGHAVLAEAMAAELVRLGLAGLRYADATSPP